MRWLVIAIVAATATGITGCDETSARSSNTLYSFQVSYGDQVTSGDIPARVRAMTGYDPDEAISSSYQESGVSSFCRDNGVRVARYPRGWGCEYTLDTMWPDTYQGDIANVSMDYTQFDAMTRSFISYYIVPVWQAIWDFHDGTCTEENGLPTGSMVENVADWVDVVATIIQRMDSVVYPYYSNREGALEEVVARGLSAGYVEVQPNPLGAGGYGETGFLTWMNTYRQLMVEITQRFAVADRLPVVDIIGPGLEVTSPDDFTNAEHPAGLFIQEISEFDAIQPGLMSFSATVSSFEEAVDIALAARAALDAKGMENVGIAMLDLRLDDDALAAISPSDTGIWLRSVYLGCMMANLRIKLQDQLNLITAFRRGGTLLTDSVTREDLFQREDGSTPLPAMLAFMPFFMMDNGTSTMLEGKSLDTNDSAQTEYVIETYSDSGSDNQGLIAMDSVETTDSQDDVIERVADADATADSETVDVLPELKTHVDFLAGKAADGSVRMVVSALPPPAEAASAVKSKYRIYLEDLPISIEGQTVTGWQLNLARVNTDSTAFVYSEGPPITAPIVADVNGSLILSRELETPGIHYIQLTPLH